MDNFWYWYGKSFDDTYVRQIMNHRINRSSSRSIKVIYVPLLSSSRSPHAALIQGRLWRNTLMRAGEREGFSLLLRKLGLRGPKRYDCFLLWPYRA